MCVMTCLFFVCVRSVVFSGHLCVCVYACWLVSRAHLYVVVFK